MSDPEYEYKLILISKEPKPDNVFEKVNFETAANRWAALGWRTVGLRANALLLERKIHRAKVEELIPFKGTKD